ncbi:unnamed protein product [Symbiodinium sp. KB8]|nr:unnamed protein product [Symbiodinium sp. KB8]CAE7531224.1 unnamed protein product [Symbiodinium sp. KB8]
MARFIPGDLAYLDYGEVPQVVHERLVVGHIEGAEYMVVTPDRDIYPEVLDASNPDITRFWPGGARGGLPRGIPAANVYSFGAINAREYRHLLEAGRGETAAERRRRGIDVEPPFAAGALGDPAPAGGPADGAPQAAIGRAGADVADQRRWVLAEYVTGHKIGDEIHMADGAVNDGDYGLHHITDADGLDRTVLVRLVGSEDLGTFCDQRIQWCRDSEACAGEERIAGDDARTLSIKYGVNGERSRGFKESVQELHVVDFDDFPFNPRTCLEYVKAISTVAESALAQHTMWVTQSGIPSGDRAIWEDDVLARVLDLALKFDGLNIANLASFELIVRRRQLIAEAHAYSPAAPTYEAADHFLQVGHRPGGAIVTQTLTKHVAEKLHQEGQILKERRKLREEKGGKGGRGRGPGKTGKDAGADAKRIKRREEPLMRSEFLMGREAGQALRNFEEEMLQDAQNWNAVSEEAARRLFECGVLGFCRRPRGRVGAFAVSKKSKIIEGKEVKRQRLILDCRQVNMQFRAPPITELGSLASLCETELQEGESLYLGGADIQDCFYACLLPLAMREFFCFGWDLSASEVLDVTGGLAPQDLGDLGHGVDICPCLTVLPMGFTWSFYLVQQLHEQCTMQSLSISRNNLFLDRGAVERGIVDGELGVVQLPAERLWNLILAFEFVGMSVFRALYDFAGRGLPKCRVWECARRECRIFSDIAPLLVGNLRRPWSIRVTCTDASPFGYGIVERDLPEETVRAIGRWNERWRFKRLPVAEWRPRDRALGLSSIDDLDTARRPQHVVEQSHVYMEDDSFDEVPFHLMKPDAWSTAKMGLWGDSSEHITLKEGRAFVLSMRRLCRDQGQRGKRCCMFVDNLALAMCISKGRAHNYNMLRICQQYSALTLACDMRVRWVPSEVNPADGPSRGSLLPSSSWEDAARLCREEGGKGHQGGHSSIDSEWECESDGSKGFRSCAEEDEFQSSSWEMVKARDPKTNPAEKRQLLSTILEDSSTEDDGPEMSRLEKKSIGRDQRKQYQRYLSSFKDYCMEFGLTWPPTELDWTLADYFDVMFLDGNSQATGQKILAAVEYAFIEKKGSLVRARRALRGWQKLMPSQSRLPLPKMIAYGMGQIMLARGHREKCLKLLMDFDLYLRPSEGMDVLGQHVLAPVAGAGRQFQKYSVIIRDQDQGKPDKTGTFDNTLILDNPATEAWLGPLLHRMALKRGRDRPLFGFTKEEFRKEFEIASKALGLKNLVTYQLRHGGASEDLNSKTRDYHSVQQRGRWRTDSSVRRYAKTGKLQKLLQEVEPHILEYCRRSLRLVPRALQGQQCATLPM